MPPIPKADRSGCVITRGGKVIGEGYNEAELRHDPTAHAEIVAMRRAGRNLQCSEFRDATLYTTLQPCGMCSMAVIWAKIGRIVHGAGHGEVHKMYFEEKHLDTDVAGKHGRNDLCRLPTTSLLTACNGVGCSLPMPSI